jgi:macrolide-specific efflux system membrane fusion protein
MISAVSHSGLQRDVTSSAGGKFMPDSEATAVTHSRPEAGAAARARALWTRHRGKAIATAVAALLAVGGYFAWQTWFAGGDGEEAVVTAVAVRGNLEDTVTATGTLQPKDFVDVGTQVSGQLRELHVEVGAVVKKGQLLAEIDPSVYQSKVDAARAQMLNQQSQLAERQAQLALAEAQFRRQQNLAREDATSTDAVQTAEAGQKAAAAQVNSMHAQIQQTQSTLRGDEANLGYTKIHAPIAGTVVSQAAKEGQTLNANQQAPIVMRIADLSVMTVQAQVSEADVSKLRIGMDVYFTTLGGNARRHYGKLRQIPPTPTVVNNVVLYDALFDVENPDQALLPQMTAQVFFVAASARNAVIVPLTALKPVPRDGQPRGERKRGERKAGGERKGGERSAGADPRGQFAGGNALVSVVDDAGKVTDREVKVGVMNRVSAQIVSGLEPGEKVVVGTRSAEATPKAQAKSALVPSAPKGGGGGRF